MRSFLPFSRVAILSPEHVFSSPDGPWNRQAQAELRGWWANAVARGADAAYARVRGFNVGETMVDFMLGLGAKVLAPASLESSGLSVTGWHSSSVEFKEGKIDLQEGKVGSTLLGCSAHSMEDLNLAEDLGYDYAFLAPIFPTQTHPGQPALGLEYLRNACRSTSLAVVALGGLDFGYGELCLEAGASAWAGIRCWL